MQMVAVLGAGTIGAVVAGIVAVVCAVIGVSGVVYTARSQKQPNVIRVGQEVAADAITTLIRERDEARAESLVKTDVIKSQQVELDDLRGEVADLTEVLKRVRRERGDEHYGRRFDDR